MRYRNLRFDIWLCLAIGALLSFLPVKIAKQILPKAYETYEEAHRVADGEIGGAAGESVYRAKSVKDLLSHDTFTVVSPGIEYRNRGGGYYGSYFMHALTLPSGELVAACINMDSVQSTGGDLYSGDSILPVGRIVYEDLTENETFLSQMEYKEKLSRTDFYVDMLGEGGRLSEEDYTELPITLIQIGTVVICFPLLHMLGSKLGLFPAFFVRKKKKASKWE
ncbi:MAG: hypothetical protein HFI63_10160 [Lachnospiraceae bacterium]|nr:hypothetical protein [Lachnospiraceae bacterium]